VELTAAGAGGAGQDVEQLVLTLSLERDDPEHLARVQVEGDALQLGPVGQVPNAEARLASVSRCPRSRA
jgi:hypothetical protein